MQLGKLKWRSKRSILELDLYFDAFLSRNGLEGLSAQELELYEQLLELDDGDLLLLFQGKSEMIDQLGQVLINKICNRI